MALYLHPPPTPMESTDGIPIFHLTHMQPIHNNQETRTTCGDVQHILYGDVKYVSLAYMSILRKAIMEIGWM